MSDRFTARLAIRIAMLVVMFLLAPGVGLTDSGGVSPDMREVLVMDVTGAIGPANAAYIETSIAEAEAREAELLVMRIDTPGGLDTSMRLIIKAITATEVPVVGYVAPTGARAASAGTYILYACPVAAMAPGTNLGAATPVQLGGLPASDPPPSRPLSDQDSASPETDEPPAQAAPAGDAKTRKVVNDAAAYIRSLAVLHGRNGEWAEQAVREGASLSAEEALERDVIDLMAPSLETLLAELDGRRVQIGETERVLRTDGATIVELQPDWKTRLLAVISDPNIAYILMLLGIYGLIYEFSNPGAVLPGTAGALSLLLALYAFQLLPINYAGLALIALGLGLMVMEVFSPSFGGLGIGGILAFVFGSLILIDTQAPGFGISLPLIFGFAGTSALVLFFVVGMALKAHQRPVVSGREKLVDAVGEALSGFPGTGRVRLHGEIWSARADEPIPPGTKVHVTGRDGLTLLVQSRPTQNYSK